MRGRVQKLVIHVKLQENRSMGFGAMEQEHELLSFVICYCI